MGCTFSRLSVGELRMRKYSSLVATALAGTLAAYAQINMASAADLLAPPGLPSPAPVEADAGFATKWYLRGDLTASDFRSPKSDYVLPGAPPIGPIDYRQEKVGSTLGGGIGAGVDFGMARMDVTYDMRQKTRYTGMVPPFNNWAYVGPFPVPSREERYDLASHTLLVNGYADLGTWYGVTPYIGAGLGVSRLTASNYVSQPLPLTAALGGVTTYSTLGDATKWNLTWALMAGISADITKNLKIDLGYRYVNMGDMKFNHIDTATGLVSANITSKNISAHELRLGLRYEFAMRDGKPLFARY